MRRSLSVRLIIPAVLLLCACFNSQTVRPAVDEVIWTPRTDFGRQVLGRMDTTYRAIVEEVRSNSDLPGVDFPKQGVLVCYAVDQTDTLWYHAFTLVDQTAYNTLRTSFLGRAASVLARRLYPVASILERHSALQQEKKLTGYWLTFWWRATDFAQDQYKLSGEWETITAVIPYQLLSDYVHMKVSIQELGKRAGFRSKMGKTEVDFSLMP
jgi:hypothetical protein